MCTYLSRCSVVRAPLDAHSAQSIWHGDLKKSAKCRFNKRYQLDSGTRQDREGCQKISLLPADSKAAKKERRTNPRLFATLRCYARARWAC